MRHENVKTDLRGCAFDFFFWFSRFEFALKGAGYLRSTEIGSPAEPSWKKFARDHRADYIPGPAACALLDASPQREIVAAGGELGFEPVPFNPGVPELDKVIELARTVRNTLFHGGKHGSAYWDDPGRMAMLLSTTIATLRELAAMGDLEAAFTGYY